MTTDRKLRVFLCHASQDKPVVRELYQRLLAEGWIDPWLDEGKLLPGQDWRTEIEEAVESSDIVVICLSNNSISKDGFVQKEMRYAKEIAMEKPEETIFLIPVRLENCQTPRGLRFIQWMDYFGENKERGYERLLESLQERFSAGQSRRLILENEKNRQEKIKSEVLYENRHHLDKELRDKKESKTQIALLSGSGVTFRQIFFEGLIIELPISMLAAFASWNSHLWYPYPANISMVDVRVVIVAFVSLCVITELIVGYLLLRKLTNPENKSKSKIGALDGLSTWLKFYVVLLVYGSLSGNYSLWETMSRTETILLPSLFFTIFSGWLIGLVLDFRNKN